MIEILLAYLCNHDIKIYPRGTLFELPKSQHQQGVVQVAKKDLRICKKCGIIVGGSGL